MNATSLSVGEVVRSARVQRRERRKAEAAQGQKTSKPFSKDALLKVSTGARAPDAARWHERPLWVEGLNRSRGNLWQGKGLGE